MNLSKDQVDRLIATAEAKDAENDIIECDIQGIANGDFKGIKRLLVEMKVQVERWDAVTEYIVMNPGMMKFVTYSLGDDINKSSYTPTDYSVWGTKLICNPHVPHGTMIGLVSLTSEHAREIVLGKLDYEVLERMDKLKAFW